MNIGTFDYIGGKYTKYVKFNSAVLWKDRQLSLPLPVISVMKERGIKTAVFIDRSKNEKWTFDVEKIMEVGERKTAGQEPQWYFPIELAKKSVVTERFEYR